jgi:hypothetical protein
VTEFERLTALREMDLLDTPREERFDRVVRLAQQFFKVPMVAVNLVDENRQWTKAGVGVGDDPELPRDASFCSRVIEQDDTLHVQDARVDPRFRDNPMVTRPDGIRFYVGQPLHAPNGQRVGALCLVDLTPRELTEAELLVLRDLGEWVEKEMAIDYELDQAAEVQRRLNPRTGLQIPGYEVTGMCVPARAAGGDFYDWFLADGQLQVTLADVMGKGLGAALIAAGVRAVLRGSSRFNALDEAVTRSAASLQQDLEETGTFVTAFAARIDLATGVMDYVDAGHGLAVVFETGGGFRRLLTDGMPMGALPDDTWTARRTVLEPGETLLMVSDGMLDYFPDPWAAVDTAQLASATTESAEQFLDEVRAVARTHRHQDDVTAVVVRRLEERR